MIRRIWVVGRGQFLGLGASGVERGVEGPLRPYGTPPHQVRDRLPQRGRKLDRAGLLGERGAEGAGPRTSRGLGKGGLAGGFGVDGGWDLRILGFGGGDLVEEVEDLLGGLALEVGEVLDGFGDQGVEVGFCGDFFFLGLRLDDLLLWTGDRGIGGFNL